MAALQAKVRRSEQDAIPPLESMVSRESAVGRNWPMLASTLVLGSGNPAAIAAELERLALPRRMFAEFKT